MIKRLLRVTGFELRVNRQLAYPAPPPNAGPSCKLVRAVFEPATRNP
jgi:hypothetical protein